MPLERREICLTNDELLEAIEFYGRQTPGVLPAGALLEVVVANHAPERPSVTATIRCTYDPVGPPVEVILNDQSVLELLLRFCVEEGIPIPRGGDKKTSVIDGLLTLVISYGDISTPRAH